MQISTLGVVKFVSSCVVGVGVGKIVGNIIKQHIQPETVLDKVAVVAATWVIGAIATEATKKYTHDTIDNVVETVSTVVANIKTGNKLNRINKGESTFDAENLDPKDFEKNENNNWVPSKKNDVIDPEIVLGLMRSGQWIYDAQNDVWYDKNDRNKGFHQTNVVGRKVEWVWVD